MEVLRGTPCCMWRSLPTQQLHSPTGIDCGRIKTDDFSFWVLLVTMVTFLVGKAHRNPDTSWNGWNYEIISGPARDFKVYNSNSVGTCSEKHCELHFPKENHELSWIALPRILQPTVCIRPLSANSPLSQDHCQRSLWPDSDIVRPLRPLAT